ncbi:hypothetical protein M4D57_23775 [Brevibacillus borstelensis]|uniref:hypothetical protein n=1 Tax=Brevibacillus borstelensis TaxID=45462 RepID=UPI0004685591|nr:hypothetical protein [Brevibacillus borstelensis]MCC0567422.1 hypothetical protein [Brevibacillus borstelensis]MCM3561558.1 hypothetical protein [Brevibacillus borstelensis]MCM3593969.1 hypothetical protein [Brevibacillus borstelensis]
MTKNHLNENYEPNKLIRLAWKWFCEIHESSLSPLAFKVGYRLYKYIMHLCSEQTTIIGDYFQFSYLKEDLASDLGVSSSALRQKGKKRNNMTVWEELESVGFMIKDGGKGKVTVFSIPLFATDPIQPIKVGTFYKNWIGEEKWLEYLNNLRDQLNGTFEERINRNWKEIDFSKENINNFKIYPKDKPHQKETKLRYQLFCLVEKHGFKVQEFQDDVFKLFGAMVKFHTKFRQEINFEVLQRAIRNVYIGKKPDDFQSLYGYLMAAIQDEEIVVIGASSGMTENEQDNLRKQLRNERIQKRIQKAEKMSKQTKAMQQHEHPDLILMEFVDSPQSSKMDYDEALLFGFEKGDIINDLPYIA